jgi:hypothetical protein
MESSPLKSLFGAAAHWSDPNLFLTQTGFDSLGRDQSSFRLSALIGYWLNRHCRLIGLTQISIVKNWFDRLGRDQSSFRLLALKFVVKYREVSISDLFFYLIVKYEN